MLEMFLCKCVDILQDMTDEDIKTVLQKAKKQTGALVTV